MATANHPIVAEADVAVLGAGPAGCALAAELGARGVKVVLVDREPSLRFPASYGMFLGAAAESLREAWQGDARLPRFLFSDGSSVVLETRYARLNSERLARLFEARLAASGVHRLSGEVRALEASGDGTRVLLRDGTPLRVRLVLDARGAAALSEVTPRAYQTALGLWLAPDEALLDRGDAWLMDFRSIPGFEAGTFLYAMADDVDGRLFVQETILAETKPGDFSELETRLLARLAAYGLRAPRIEGRERCLIPLGVPISTPNDRVLFGAAAGFAQPATGYQITHALVVAPRVADAVARSLDAPGPTLVDRARRAVWTEDERAARSRHELGLEVLLGLPAEEREAFLRTFVTGPSRDVASYLEGTASRSVVDRLLWRQFLRTDTRTKGKLVAFGARYSARKLTSFSNES